MKVKKGWFVVMGALIIMLATTSISPALIGPDQDLSDFPPWIWPIIRPVAVFSSVITEKDIAFELAAKNMEEAVMQQCKCMTAGKYSFNEMLAMVDAQFDMQLTTLNFAKTKVAGFGMGSMVAFDDDDWCGTPPQPRPWPPYLLELVKLQTKIFSTELPAIFKLNRDEIKILNADLNSHIENFAIVLK